MPVRLLALLVTVTVAGGPATPVTASAPPPPSRVVAPAFAGWRWPLAEVRTVRHYAAPAHAYGAGHRGLDLAADIGMPVSSPAAGIVAFSGVVVDRGVVTIDHGNGLVTTLEPVTDALRAGTTVSAGQQVAVAGLGGHAGAGTLHFGVRRHGEYINPMLLLGGIPRAVLLPCC